ncbi:MAG: hypothetical protein CL933_02050 [Deltaproteobacteria bacterium]|nr:hypothetical protein [Deltaproteobacteria bacterium]
MAARFDLNARLNLSSVVLGEGEDGSFEWARMNGMGFSAMGTAASAAVAAATLDREQVRHLFGVVSVMAPTPVVKTLTNRMEHNTMKYANYSGTAQTGMMALAFAQQGYVDKQNCLDGRASSGPRAACARMRNCSSRSLARKGGS